MKIPTRTTALLGLVLAVAGACGAPPPREPASGALVVFASVPPYAAVAGRVGGEHVVVHTLVAPGQNPHTFQLSPRQMQDLARARLFFASGLPFEAGLRDKLAEGQSRLRIVDLYQGEPHAHEDGHGHDHDHGDGLDPHNWLSPDALKAAAQAMADAMAREDAANAAAYAANADAFAAAVDEVDARIRQTLAPHEGRSFLVFHPAFGHFAEAYGLHQEAVEIKGKTPTPKELEETMRRAREEGVRVIFVQPQFDRKAAETVAEAIDAELVEMDPLAADVLGNMERIAEAVAAALGEG